MRPTHNGRYALGLKVEDRVDEPVRFLRPDSSGATGPTTNFDRPASTDPSMKPRSAVRPTGTKASGSTSGRRAASGASSSVDGVTQAWRMLIPKCSDPTSRPA